MKPMMELTEEKARSSLEGITRTIHLEALTLKGKDEIILIDSDLGYYLMNRKSGRRFANVEALNEFLETRAFGRS